MEVLNTLMLSKVDGKTELTLQGGPINASEAERKTFEDNFGSLQQGFMGTLDSLEQYLETA